MNRVTTENLRSQMEQADAGFRDLFDEYSTEQLGQTLQAFSCNAAKCPASTIFVTIEDLGAGLAASVITHAVSRALAQLLLARWEAEESDG